MFAYNIFLIGFMGTGKSTVAAYMEQNYRMQILEMDQEIVKMEGLSIQDIFAQKGEAYFREIETKLLANLKMQKNQVVSCGGGAVLREENISYMKQNGKIVLLTASPQSILERVKEDEGRPLLTGKKNVAAIEELMAARREQYEKAADIRIQTDNKSIDEICQEIVRLL